MTEISEDFRHALPSRRLEELARAIGRTLLDVRRLVITSPDEVSEAARPIYFSRFSGPVEFLFDGGIGQRLDTWSEEFSVIVVDEPLVGLPSTHVISLAQDPWADPRLKACLGLRCEDVRIWTAREEFDTDEAMEAGVSYRVAGGHELIYCTFLESELSDDLVLPVEDLPRNRVRSCFSVAERTFVRC
jgi:hypothetical protein